MRVPSGLHFTVSGSRPVTPPGAKISGTAGSFAAPCAREKRERKMTKSSRTGFNALLLAGRNGTEECSKTSGWSRDPAAASEFYTARAKQVTRQGNAALAARSTLRPSRLEAESFLGQEQRRGTKSSGSRRLYESTRSDLDHRGSCRP